MKRFLRGHTVLPLIIIGVIFTLAFVPIGTSPKTAHAATTTPTIRIPSAVLHPYHYVPLTAQGFASGETVYVYVDNIKSPYPSTRLACDTTGTCKGQLSLFGIGLAYGPHILFAQGEASGLQAQTPFTLVTGINVSPSQGGVGTALEVDGAAFAANETVNIYWGSPSASTLIGSATCTPSGQFVFTNKANGDPFTATGAPGPHQVTVVRQNHKPATFIDTFHLLTPTIQAPASITFGKPASTTVSGFGANETVTFSWNANGGQVLGTAQTDYLGRAFGNFSYPSAPPGSYILTVKGATSGVIATHTLHVGTGIEVAISSFVFPGETLTINGGGFSPNQNVRVYFQTTSNGVVPATADTTGAFSVPLTLPATYTPTTSYYVHAVSADGKEHAEAPLSFSPPDVFIGVADPGFGTQWPVQGDNFAVNETVAIYWDYGQPNQVQVSIATVDGNGQFSATVTPPSDPHGSNVTLAAVGQKSHLVATQTLTPGPALLFPTSVPGGVATQLQGGDFGQNETVNLQFMFNDGTTVPAATVQTDARGGFSASITAPLSTSTIGQQITLTATGNTSGVSAMISFTEEPVLTITPTTGPSGTTITLTAQGYLPSSTVPVIWFDPSTHTTTALGTATVASDGQFTQTVTAPNGLVSGAIYYVEALASNGQYIGTTFTAQ